MATLKIGGKEVTFKKSEKYIGVKPHLETEGNLSRDVENSDMETAAFLGGFNVLTTPDDVDAGERLNELRDSENVAVGTHVYQTEEGGEDYPVVPTGEIYVVFQENAKHRACVDLLKKYHLEVTEVRGTRELIVKTTPSSPNPIKVAMLMQDEPALVEICEPNMAYRIQQTAVQLPNDKYFNAQWYLRNTGVAADGTTYGLKVGADAKVIDAWNELGNMGASNIVVAVVDDGFDLSHPDFQGKVVKPFDFETRSTTKLLLRADDTHGTSCAGVAIAANNGSGVVGVAPNARFMPIRTYGIDDIIVERLVDYWIDNGADVISNSWGIPGKVLSSRMIAAFNKAATKGRQGRGCVVLFAAGNEGSSVSGFASHPDVICVGASSSIDKWSSYSNQGPSVWITAPSNGDGGLAIVTTDVGKMVDENGNSIDAGTEGLYRDDFGGTSSATPLAAGVCALILSANPNLTAKQVKEILASSADKIDAPSYYDAKGHSNKLGYGRINSLRAVRKAKSLTGQAAEASVNEMPPVLLKATTKGVLAGTNAAKYYNIVVGSQLIIQGKPISGNLDIDLYLKKGAQPNIARASFDKKSALQGGMDYIVDNAASFTDYYLVVHAKSGVGQYGLQITLGGVANPISPTVAASVGGISPLRLQAVAQGKMNAAGEQHLFRIALGDRLAFQVDGPDNSSTDFDLYIRKNNIPIPSGRQYDDSSSESDTSDEKVLVESSSLVPANYFILVRSVAGSGEFGLTVQLGS